MTHIVTLLTGLLLLASISSQAQTTVDLRTQSRNVDFSSAASTRPAKTGTVLPPACQSGDLFFKTNNTAGQNLYGCTAANTWTLQSGSGGSGASTASQLSDFAVGRSSGTVISIGSSCSVTLPCNVRFGNTVHTFTVGATATITGGTGSGLVLVFVSNSGAIVVEHASLAGVTMTCSGCVASQVATPAWPLNGIPLASLSISSGQWGTTVTDMRSMFSSRAITAGSGVQLTDGLGDVVVSVDPADVPRLGANNNFVGDNDFSSATRLVLKNSTGTPSPSECTAGTDIGRVYVRSDAASTQSSLYVCANTGSGTYAWELVQGGGGGSSFTMATANSGWFDLTGSGGGNFNPSAANTSYFLEIHLPFALKISNMGYNMPAGNFASNYIAWGIYNSSCTLIAGTSGRGALSTGAHVAAVANAATIGPGVFYLGFAFDSASPVLSTSNRFQHGILQAVNPPRIFRGSSAPTGSGSSLAMPASCGTKTADSFVVPTLYVVE